MIRLALILALALGAALAGTGPAFAVDYPVRPVKWIVPYPPGGTTDVLARIMAVWLSEKMGQAFVIENKPGGGNNIGVEMVVTAPPDGYTMLLVNPANGINATLYKDLRYNFIRDIAPVAGLVRTPNVMEVRTSFPAKTVAEFIAYCKANPGKINMASSGSGTSVHLSGELFKSMTGCQMLHVPYKGAGPALVDVIAGQVHMTFGSVLSSLGHVKNGRLRALGVTGAKRSVAAPELPTLAEAGVKGYRTTTWYGLLAPANTPATITNRLVADMQKAIDSPDIKNRLLTDGAEPAAGTPKQFHDFLVSEMTRAREIIQRAGVTP